MGGGVGGGVGIDSEPSPRRAAIEKAQAELRLEFVVREERRRELEFLEKGGNPLDFKFGEPTSGFLSPSPTDPLAEQYLSRGLNTADNFAGDTEVVDAERGTFSCDGKINVAQEGQTSHVEGSRTETHIKESEDSGGVRMGVKGYARRNRPKGNRYTGHASLKDSVKSGTCDQLPNLAAGIKGRGEAKDIESETLADKTYNVLSNNNSKPTSLNRNGMLETSTHKKHFETDSNVPPKQEASRNDANVNLEGSDPGSRDATCSDKVENHKCSSEVDADQDVVPRNIVTSMVGRDGANQCSSLVNDRVDTDKIVQNVVIAEQSLDKGPTSCVNDCDKGVKFELESNNKASLKTAVDVGKSDTEGIISANVKETLGSLECSNAANDKALMSERIPESRSIDNIKEIAEPSCADLHMRRRNSKPDDKCLGTSDVLVKTEEGLLASTLMQTEVPKITPNQEVKLRNSSQLLENKEERQIGGLNSFPKLAHPQSKSGVSVPSKKHSGINLSLEKGKNSGGNAEAEFHKPTLSATAKKAHEDLILESAKHLKARLKKNAELAKTKPFLEPPRRDSHWDFVLTEMEWLANDFMQERRWKLTAAAQFSHEIAEGIGNAEYREEALYKKQRKGARKIAFSVMQFWQAAEALVCCRNEEDSLMSRKKMSNDEVVQKEIDESDVIMLECNKEPKAGKSLDVSPLQQYAIRHLKYTKDSDNTVQAEAPSTPERLLDAGILEPSWEDQFPEESLFYTVPCGAMELYRNSVESYWASLEKESMEAWTDADTQLGFSPRERAFCEDDDLRAQYLPGAFEGSKITKARKKKIKMPKAHGRIPSGDSHGFSQRNIAETITGMPSITAMNGKRTASSANLNAGAPIPTKRIRSSTIAARQRAAGSLSGGTTGASGHANKTDVSSGDTSSLQDEFNTLIEGSQSRRSMEIDNYGKSLHSDGGDMFLKPRKKKKSKQFGMGPSSSAMDAAGTLGVPGNGLEYEPKWQQDVTSQLDQREQTKRKLETQVFLPSTVLGSSLDHQMTNSQGIGGQTAIKKLKLSKQLSDMSPQAPATISAPSPGASQMSNMSNSSKPIKFSTNRDKGRRYKTPKAAANHTGQGIAWSTFEDQALVVLVHDVGPNWELVSDIINSSLQIKCIFRKPKDCKERHKSLMERTSGDGGDSPEDSGSSQPYPSTLPGIPKGSARMLLQRLQGPMEEEALKTHFEKIVQIGQQQHVRKTQNDNQEQKQRAPEHPSHFMATQNIAGPFTPLDLCDKPSSSTEISPQGYPIQGPHSSGMLNSLGAVSPLQPGSVGIPSLQGPSTLPLGGNLVASSSALNVAGASREMQRFSSARPISVKMDEQQRMQQYNQMIAARSLQVPGVSMSASHPMGLPNSSDRGSRILPGGNAAGLLPGLNRGIPVPRPGYSAMGAPGIMSLGSPGINNILPCNGVGLSTTGTVTSVAISGQVNLIPRSRDSMQMLRPSQTSEDQRQMLMQELQIQPAQGNGQAAAPYSTLNGSFSNQMASSPNQNYTGQHQQHQGHGNLQSSQLQNASHSPAYMIQLQRQRLIQQQHYVSNGSQLSQSQPHPLPQAKHAISTVPNSTHQQHSLPQHVLQQQHTGAQQQSKTQSPPGLQNQSSQQSGPSAMNTSVLSAQKRQPSLPQTQGQNYQGAGQSNILQQNQMQKQHQQRQQQLKHQAQPQQQQKSQLQGQQQQQQQSRVSKGLERGGMMMQNISADLGQVNGPQGPVTGNQHPEKDQMVQLVPGQRVFHGSGSLQPGKQMIQSAMSGQQGQVTGQIPVSLPQNLALSQQQKGFVQQSSMKQQPSSSLTTDNHQATVSSPSAAQLQQQMPSCQAQSCSVPMSSLSSSSQQQRQSIQSQQLAHRKLPHRQSGPDVGLQPSSQTSKSCVPQQDQVASQLSSQQGHLAFQVGSNVGVPLSTASAAPASSLADTVHSNNNVVNSVQWKTGQSVAQTSSMPYSLNNHNGVPGTQISPTVSTSGMLLTSTNGNAGVSTTTSSGMLASGTNIAGLPQRQYSSIGQVHGHNTGSHTPIGARPPPGQQIGVQWQPQQTMSQQQQQRQTHNGIQSSIHTSLGSGYNEPPTSGPM